MTDIERREAVREAVLGCGAVAAGFAMATEVPKEVSVGYDAWIDAGKHAGMEYLRRHSRLKTHPCHVLEGVRTVISVAFSYAPPCFRAPELPMIACYAYGSDYHDVLRRRLLPVAERLKGEMGGEWRICIDSAPLHERYWALRCGIGIEGKNGSVIVGDAGGFIFLAELLTTLQLPPDCPSGSICSDCGACRRACPQNALDENGAVDARRCLNYLTIEHRGDWDTEGQKAMSSIQGKRTLYGCDICLRVCPHNSHVAPTSVSEFMPRPEIMDLTASDVAEMTQSQFSAIFKGSPIKRAKLEGLRRNARNILEPD